MNYDRILQEIYQEIQPYAHQGEPAAYIPDLLKVDPDRYGICHVPLGKKSFSEQQLVENYAALYTEILRVKPSSAKGKYVKSISVSSTMGPGVKVDPAVQRDFLAE